MRRALVLGTVVTLVAVGCGDGDRGEGGVARRGMEVQTTDSALHTFTAGERAAITEVAEATEAEVRALLPDLAPALVLTVMAGTTVIPETGEVGAAVRPEVLRWLVDPTRPGGVEAVARAQLRSTLFHELHHTVRGHVFSNDEPYDSFMDGVIAEGMASVFERDHAADREVPWAEYPDDVEAWVAELRALPADADYEQWMFQHADGRRWIGYRAGAFLVDRAIEASGRTSAELVRTPTAEILALAGYD